jgi:hypothetical protein
MCGIYRRLTSPAASATAAAKNKLNSATVEQIVTIFACIQQPPQQLGDVRIRPAFKDRWDCSNRPAPSYLIDETYETILHRAKADKSSADPVENRGSVP